MPNWYFFRYLQLSHAFKSQFGSDSLDIESSPIESLLSEENLKTPLSEVYKGLFVETPKMLNKCRDTWSAIIPDFGRDDWDDMWDHTFGTLVSARLIQFKLLHRIYYTPERLAGIYGTDAGECWRCAHSPADFDHIFWHCQEIREFWTGVTCTVQSLLQIPIPLTVSVCLLGLLEGIALRRAQRTLISISLFYARKAIICYWKRSESPTVSFWKDMINKALPLYKATYLSRGCPTKFEKVWQCWIDANET